jgi:hypothetical protein
LALCITIEQVRNTQQQGLIEQFGAIFINKVFTQKGDDKIRATTRFN